VLLGEEHAPDAGQKMDGAPAVDASNSPEEVGTRPIVSVGIKPTDCGMCFELHAEGVGGRPPYEFEWEDGSRGADHRVCVTGKNLLVHVLARDAAASSSERQAVQLDRPDDAGCPQPTDPMNTPDPSPPARICLQNLSFDGTPAPNLGQDQIFDAKPWNVCANLATANTPDIGNDSIAQTPGVPAPTSGPTFLGLAEGEQVSQAFCSPIADSVPLSFELDLSRINLNGGLAPETEQVFLEIYGGLSVDCSQRELLWASKAIKVGWQTECATIRPRAFMTQLTLRANTDMTLPSVAYLLVDSLKPVDRCP
jgi:hypothetical protein